MIGCKDEIEKLPIDESEMLEIVLYNGLHHFQSKTEQKLLKENKIKSISFVKNILSTSVVDSLTFLEIDKSGRIKTKTTTECTTIGCLPYTIKQIYNFEDNRIKRMDDFVFKKKYNTQLDYWNENDTNHMSKFDWEDYTYKNDSIIVESATQYHYYELDSLNRIVSYKLDVKMNNQFSKINYNYFDTKIETSILNNFIKEPRITEFKIAQDNTVIYSNKIHKAKRVFSFNEMGLLNEIEDFKKDTLRSIIKINYLKY